MTLRANASEYTSVLSLGQYAAASTDSYGPQRTICISTGWTASCRWTNALMKPIHSGTVTPDRTSGADGFYDGQVPEEGIRPSGTSLFCRSQRSPFDFNCPLASTSQCVLSKASSSSLQHLHSPSLRLPPLSSSASGILSPLVSARHRLFVVVGRF